MQKSLNKKIFRIIDANLNRLKEGLRVCEDITRFIIDDTEFTTKFKNIRHRISSLIKCLPLEIDSLIDARDTQSDVGRHNRIKSEAKRKDAQDIFRANIQRVKESLRVLEEFTKLLNSKASLGFKFSRYKVYTLEKKIIERFSALRNLRQRPNKKDT